MTTMLIISRYCAYDGAGYAGSKTHNYYLKRLIKDFSVKLITIAHPEDLPKLDFEKYGIDAEVIPVDEAPRRAWFFVLHNLRNIGNYFGKTLGVVNGYVGRRLVLGVKKIKRQGLSPDIILLEWTQTLLLVDQIRKLFPSALYIASEHDVSFLRLQRQYLAAKGLRAIMERLRYESLKKVELSSLDKVDLIVPHNFKDRNLLIASNIAAEKVHAIAPYYTDYSDVTYSPRGNTILFFGAMDREENYGSAAWFIERVFNPLLDNRFMLTIVGGKPHPSLDKYKSERIVITGFVADIRPYLSGSLCKVAPLQSGAGIKVKVIEAMSAGLPVLANTIAIEGIPAIDKKHYVHCEKPEEFAEALEMMAEGRIDVQSISSNSKKLVADTFNLEKSYAAYREAIGNLRPPRSLREHFDNSSM